MLPDERALLELGGRARQYVVDQHSIEREAAGLHAIYDELLGGATAVREPRDAGEGSQGTETL